VRFHGYLRNIEATTGSSPDQFRQWGADKGFATADGLTPGVRPGIIAEALKEEFGLGHGHSMAIVALLKGSKGAEG
jgi:hypothetical protein